ncbi:hypothetical protein AXW83_06325 [Bosea sp. PAMC 26642]|nr:hypothetical protein AXW83_06325 [Bosea sp. PAMC 26642]
MSSSSHQPFATFLFEYRHDGDEWAFTIQAKDAADARERLKALTWARYQGQLVAVVPAAAGPLAKAAVWLRNAFVK